MRLRYLWGKHVHPLSTPLTRDWFNRIIDGAKAISSPDPLRYATILGVLRDLQARGICGDVVELGCYKGVTTKFLDEASLRNVYAFETFEGISDGRFKADKAEVQEWVGGFVQWRGDFRKYEYSTYVALGIVDLDEYQLCLDGLHFLHKQMAPGGVILLHDYLNEESNQGAFRAAQQFEKDTGLTGVYIPDMWGTYAIAMPNKPKEDK